MKNQFLRHNSVENIANMMSQSVWNIIMDDQIHILDLIKSHKGTAGPSLKQFPAGIAKTPFSGVKGWTSKMDFE